jgi:hypothetical protein
MWASQMTSCTAARPRAFKLRGNAVQNAPSSLSPTATPSTSRVPSAHTLVATTIAWETAASRGRLGRYVSSLPCQRCGHELAQFRLVQVAGLMDLDVSVHPAGALHQPGRVR